MTPQYNVVKHKQQRAIAKFELNIRRYACQFRKLIRKIISHEFMIRTMLNKHAIFGPQIFRRYLV